MLSKTIYAGTCAHIDWRVAEHRLFLAWCGYVRLPEGHPWLDYRGHGEAIPADVHGGITYGPDGDGWIGFDTMHAGDALLPKGLPAPIPSSGRFWSPQAVRTHTIGLAIQADDAYLPVLRARLEGR